MISPWRALLPRSITGSSSCISAIISSMMPISCWVSGGSGVAAPVFKLASVILGLLGFQQFGFHIGGDADAAGLRNHRAVFVDHHAAEGFYPAAAAKRFIRLQAAEH